MPIGAAINQVTQIGAEATSGTTVPAVRRLASLGINISEVLEAGKTRPRGQKFAAAHPINREWTEGELEGNAAYNEMQYPFSSILKKVTPTSIALTFANSTAYTAGQIVSGGGYYHKVTTPGTSAATGTPTWPTTLGGTVTSGTVTFTNVGPSTTPLQQWIFDPDTFAKDVIQSYTIEMVDTQRNRASRINYGHFTEFTMESSRADEIACGGTVVGRALQTGVTPTTAGLVIARPLVATPAHVNVYLDTSSAQLGMTKLEANFGYNLSLSDRFNQAWVHDRAVAGWKEPVEAEPSFTLELTIAEDTIYDTILANARKGDRAFIRFEALGPEIILNSGIYYALEFDMACQVSDAPERDEEEDAYVVTVPFEAEHDDTWGRAVKARLVNTNTAL